MSINEPLLEEDEEEAGDLDVDALIAAEMGILDDNFDEDALLAELEAEVAAELELEEDEEDAELRAEVEAELAREEEEERQRELAQQQKAAPKPDQKPPTQPQAKQPVQPAKKHAPVVLTEPPPESKPTAINKTGGVQTEDGRILFGMDAETYLKMKSKEDPDFERKCGEWIEKMLEEPLPVKGDIWNSLKDGIILCRVLNKIKPSTTNKFNMKQWRGKMHPLAERENITVYLEGCWKIGLSASDIFVVSDLHGRQNMGAVLNNIAALSQIAFENGGKLEPLLQLKKKSLEELKANKAPSKHGEITFRGPVFSGECEDDDPDQAEEQLRSVTLQLEESERTIQQLETAKRHLNNLLVVEKQKVLEGQKEVGLIRSRGQQGDVKFCQTVTKMNAQYQQDLEELRKKTAQNPEKEKLRAELKALKDEIAVSEELVKTGGVGITPSSAKGSDAEKAELAQLREKVSHLELENKQALDKYEHAKTEWNDRMETAKKELERMTKAHDEVAVLRKKIADLESQKISVTKNFEEKLENIEVELEAAKAEAEDEKKSVEENIEKVEAERAQNQEKFTSIQEELARELDGLQSGSFVDTTKQQNEINSLVIDIQLLADQCNSVREKMTEEFELAKNNSQNEVDKVREKMMQLEEQKTEMEVAFITEKNTLEDKIYELKSELSQKISDLNKDIEQQKKEKQGMIQTHLANMQQLQRTGFEKESALKKEIDVLQLRKESNFNQLLAREAMELTQEQIVQNFDAQIKKLQSQIEQLRREKEMLKEQFSREKDQLIQKNISEFDRVEKLILEEKIKKEKLEEEIKNYKTKMEAEIQKEAQKRSEETEKQKKSIESLESEKKELVENSEKKIADIQSEIDKIKSENSLNSAKIQSRITELEIEKKNLTEDREKLKDTLQQRIQKKKERNEKEIERLETRIKTVTEENKNLIKQQKEFESEKVLMAKSTQEERFIENLKKVRESYQVSMKEQTELNKEVSEKKARVLQEREDLSTRFYTSEQKWLAERATILTAISTATEEVKNVEFSLKNRAQAPAMTAAQADKRVKDPRKRRQTARFAAAPLAGADVMSIEEKLGKLRDSITRIMLGEEIPEKTEEIPAKYKDLFKMDTVRRTFTFIIKEYAENALKGEAEEGGQGSGVIYLTQKGFDLLKAFVDLVLNSIDLSTGAEFISGKILLETSSQFCLDNDVDKSIEQRSLQEVIKPHQCWQNTQFWQEYFWATTTPKFSEKFAESSDISQEQEHKFYEAEILKFSVMMYGWGSLSREKTVLFVGSLSESCGLPPDAHQSIVKKVDTYHIAQSKAKAAGRGQKRKTVQFVSRAHAQHRQTLSVSRADLENAGIAQPLSGGVSGSSEGVGGRVRERKPARGASNASTTSAAIDAVRQKAPPTTSPASPLAVPTKLEDTWNRQRKSVRRRADTADPTESAAASATLGVPGAPKQSNRRMAAKSVVITADVNSFINGMLKNQEAFQ